MQLQKFDFPGPGGQRLAALLDLPLDGKPAAYALFAHCFTCSKNVRAAYHISRALAREGIAVLRFDFTGLGESGGDFADTGFLSNVEDLIAAARFMESRFEGPAMLIGHSLGGAAVLTAAPSIPTSKAVVTIAAPADPRHVSHVLGPAAETIRTAGEAEVDISGRTFVLRKKFLDDLAAIDWTTRSASKTRPKFFRRPATPRASSRSTRPTTCCRNRPIRAMPGRSSRPGPNATSRCRPRKDPPPRRRTTASRPAPAPAGFSRRSG